MKKRPPASLNSIQQEVRLIVKRGKQVWHLVPRQHKIGLIAAAIVMALIGVLNTLVPLLIGKVIDEAQQGLQSEIGHAALYRLCFFFLGLIALGYLGREVLKVLQSLLVENSCTRIEKSMTVRLVGHLMRVDLSKLSHEKIGALHGRISRSVVGFSRFLRLLFLTLFPVLVTGSFALAAAVMKQPWLGLVMIGVIPMSAYLTVRQLLSQRGVRLSLMRGREDMDGTVVELLHGLDYVRAANTHEREIHRVGTVAEKRRVKEIHHLFQMSLFGCAKALNEGFFHILVLSLAIYLAVQGRIHLGDIAVFSMLFLNVMAPLSELHRVIDEGHECSLQVRDLLNLLAEPTDPSFAPPEVREPVIQAGEPLLVAQDLVVEYMTADGQRRRALDGVSLTIRHGQSIGVAGRSGSGKSTWLRVLMRLTHPESGSVSIGGVPLASISREAIGRHIGYVGQSPFVFSGTIRDNIVYGREDATQEQIEQAARMAYIHDEIMAWPQGYDSPVLERGANLSGGQRQRLALARIFLKDPSILILDEGTSALDNISEKNVQAALARVRADRTIIMVAHRLSTLVVAEQIFVFENGRIVETGNFRDLVDRGGAFAELVRSAGESPAGMSPTESAQALGLQAVLGIAS
jgi:ATP-binding cassette subfamily B protein